LVTSSIRLIADERVDSDGAVARLLGRVPDRGVPELRPSKVDPARSAGPVARPETPGLLLCIDSLVGVAVDLRERRGNSLAVYRGEVLGIHGVLPYWSNYIEGSFGRLVERLEGSMIAKSRGIVRFVLAWIAPPKASGSTS